MTRYLKTFLIAAQTSSFSAAGAYLGLTQSAVSTQIKKLEQALDCELFERKGKAVVLSPRGKELVPVAQEILGLFESMKGQSTTQARGKIEIGAISTVQLGLLPDALSRFRQQFPQIEVHIIPGTSVQLMSLIDAQELDIAVMIKPSLRMPKGLSWTTLLRESYAAIAPVGTAQTTVRDLLRDHPFIRYSRRSYGGQLVDKFLKHARIQVNDTMELDEPAVILEMVKKGLGVSIIPYQLAASESQSTVRVLALEGRDFFREIGILQRESTGGNKGIQAIVDSLVATSLSVAKKQTGISR